MTDKPFARPITVEAGPVGQYAVIACVAEAVECLLQAWPVEPGPRHRDALDACYKVLDGHRSTEDAESAFLVAAEEAGILVEEDDQPPLRP